MTLKYDEHGHPYEDLTEENKKLQVRIKELDNSLSMALDINDTYQRENKKLKDKAQQVEGVCISGALKKDLNKGKEIDYHRYWKDMYEKEHKLRQEAEGETTIVKGIGMNSPEMKAFKKEIYELKANLARAKEDHQFDNLVHQKELESLRKK